MNASIRQLTPFSLALVAAGITQGAPAKESAAAFTRLCLARHSPIRRVRFEIVLTGIPYYAHVQLLRHTLGWNGWIVDADDLQPYVRSQRPTALSPVDYDRGAARQDTPVNMLIDCNLEALFNVMGARLCAHADPVAQEAMRLVRDALPVEGNEFMSIVRRLCAPKCFWQGRTCHEPRPCGKFPKINLEDFPL